MYPTIIQNSQCKRECLHKKALQKSSNEQSVDAHFPSLIPRLNQEYIPARNIPRFPVYEAYWDQNLENWENISHSQWSNKRTAENRLITFNRKRANLSRSWVVHEISSPWIPSSAPSPCCFISIRSISTSFSSMCKIIEQAHLSLCTWTF